MPQPFRAAGYAVMGPVLCGENGQSDAFGAFGDEGDIVGAAEAVMVPGDHFASVPPAIAKSIGSFGKHGSM
jgi:hypothetical protein